MYASPVRATVWNALLKLTVPSALAHSSLIKEHVLVHVLLVIRFRVAQNALTVTHHVHSAAPLQPTAFLVWVLKSFTTAVAMQSVQLGLLSAQMDLVVRRVQRNVKNAQPALATVLSVREAYSLILESACQVVLPPAVLTFHW